ncbi:MAG: hotdog family protein [Methylobacter sp.]|uniref:Hotdog family protein n=1 Tax=Candidatus Methylobacter titanis TaxID=3053457 RepID=A0AA43Q8U8_9GAMM|nr:hotdog family protein [Candidatus Methylobacter titanis]
MNAIVDDCMDAGGTTPWMHEVEQCMEQLPRATQGAVADLIPHTGSMVLLDRIIDCDDQGLTAEVVVRGDGLLGDDRSVPAWVGIEYMAQTIAAYAGVMAKQVNEPIRLGFLLGTRRYSSNVAVFKVGSTLTIRVKNIMQDDNLGVFDCRILGEGVDVTANLNVYQPPLNKSMSTL